MPIDRAAVNQFLLLQTAGLGSRAMGYDKKCKCCAERRRTEYLINQQELTGGEGKAGGLATGFDLYLF